MRLLASIAAAVLVPLGSVAPVGAAAPVSETADAATGEPAAPESIFDVAANAHAQAVAALEFDQWTATNLDLELLRLVFARNVDTQLTAVGSSVRDLNRLNLLLDGAQREFERAQIEKDRVSGLYRDLAVGVFVAGHPGSQSYPSAAIDRVRRAETIDSITGDFATTLADADADLAEASELLADRTADVAAGEAALVAAETAVADSEQIQADFEARVVERDEMIQDRIIQALEDYQVSDQLVRVEGFRVHASIAEPLTLMLAAAREEGVELAGWGWRSRGDQINLRRSHCGDSGHALFDQDSSSCRPPTARPGSSQHELGLAIDFTQNGSVLTWGSSGFDWLMLHGAEYGFYNLPSEAWHWSTTGN